MKNDYLIAEDTLPSNFPVWFSRKIQEDIETIVKFNESNKESLSMWTDDLNSIIDRLSQRSIAWDYANQQSKLPNHTLCMYADGFNIGYTVKNNSYGAYVYVFMINY